MVGASSGGIPIGAALMVDDDATAALIRLEFGSMSDDGSCCGFSSVCVIRRKAVYQGNREVEEVIRSDYLFDGALVPDGSQYLLAWVENATV